MSLQHSPVVVLGAGLTGMSAFFHLKGRGIEHRVIERLAHPGGHAITVEDSGYRFDRTGHLLHLRNPAMRELALNWLGGQACTVHRRSMIWTHGVYTRYPFQANTQGLPPKVAYECLMGFLEAHYAAHPTEPENFEDFCLRHFGEGISKYFMIPYNCRLWGVHPREITAAWCSRFVPLPKLQDVVAGAVGLGDRELGYNTEFLYPRTGIGELPRAMAAELPHIEYERLPVGIDPHRREIHLADGSTIDYRTLVSTAPLDQLCALLNDVPEGVREAASRLRCNALQYLDVALDVPIGKPLHWVYVPEERYPFYRVGCYSNFSDAMAPAGKSCLYIELVDRREPDLDALLPEVADGLVEMGLIEQPTQIVFARKRKIDYAYVIFDHAYFESVDRVQRFLRDNHIVSTGRYGGWNYSSMEDALLFGRDAAEQVAELVR